MPKRKIVGYGICGPGEAGRYMRATLDEFKRLCDEVIILSNNAGPEAKSLIYEYGFTMVQDNREWGKEQWGIKQDFIEKHVAKKVNKGDTLVCLDMDEVFSADLTKEWLLECPLEAYHVFVVDLWNDPEHYKPESCFWNVRIWRWNGETKWKQKPLHCGLAPEWTYLYHRHAPFILKHYGLMAKEDRERKIKRYALYDPQAKHLDYRYYEMLKSDRAIPFDEKKVCATIKDEVTAYKQKKPIMTIPPKKVRYAYVKNPAGMTLDIPEYTLEETLKRKGFEFIGWAADTSDEMAELFGDIDLEKKEEDVIPEEAAAKKPRAKKK